MSELIQVILKNVLHMSIRGWFELQVSILGASSLDGLGVYMDASNENAARVHRGLSVAVVGFEHVQCIRNAHAIHNHT